ncbi:hypothetical protein SKAU_G00390220 [Synaphobranchus kaupii]|uniref:Uncharacterized protein n=1 Tax=Synaphobranchus kaupii TaxID=118154 RepID=A0A9Q1EBB6_SYNKA|nr:hypothetical protein SKAU_G00390220 [Synaphobranchus kaupii]
MHICTQHPLEMRNSERRVFAVRSNQRSDSLQMHRAHWGGPASAANKSQERSTDAPGTSSPRQSLQGGNGGTDVARTGPQIQPPAGARFLLRERTVRTCATATKPSSVFKPRERLQGNSTRCVAVAERRGRLRKIRADSLLRV